MKHSLSALLMAASLAFTTHSFADERTEHFKGLPSPDLAAAVNNFNEYNQLLAAQLNGELTPQALAEIHQLTYTLEIALEKIGGRRQEIHAGGAGAEKAVIRCRHSRPEP